MNDLIHRLEHAMREYILDAMPEDPSGHLAAEPLADLLMSFATWRSRLVLAQPRRCHLSRELHASAKAGEHKAALDAIVQKIRGGDDITPHLSKRVRHGRDPRRVGEGSPAARRDRDLMVADWGIHHLHLSTEEESGSGFVKRSGDLLFVAFKPTDAYLIGIYDHVSDWARRDILATLVRNWPDAGIVLPTSALGLTQQFSDADRQRLRNAGISGSMVEVDGKVWAAAAIGQTLTGEPYSASRLRMVVIHTLDDWRAHFDERLAGAARAVDATAGREVTGEWEPTVHDGWAGLVRDGVFHPIVALT
jgi:hypothetical protein